MGEITATREYSLYEEICTLTPFIQRLSREFKNVACEFCFKRNPNLIYCEACLDMKYCGKECLENDWENHKLECQRLKNLPLDRGFIEIDTTRVHGNTILKIKGKDWKSIKSNVMGMDVSFDDIDANHRSLPIYEHILCNLKKEYVRKYIGDENMPNDEDFKQIFEKVRNFIFPIPIREHSVQACKVLFESSVFEIKCIPNCYMISRNGMDVIKAGRKIEKSEKLSLNRIPLFGTVDMPGISFKCSCTDCRLPYGESLLSKVEDEQSAIEVIIMTQQFLNSWGLYKTLLSIEDVEYLVDSMLEEHEGVLGDTNALHLQLLFIKCFDLGADPREVRSHLLKLEKSIVAVFGEYHPYLAKVYSAISKSSLAEGNISEFMVYHEKAMMALFSLLHRHQECYLDTKVLYPGFHLSSSNIPFENDCVESPYH